MNELDELIQADLVNGCELVIKNKITDYEFKYLSPNRVIEYLENKYNAIHEDNDNFDTNGWHWDWWDKITIKDKVYGLSGSGYYGGVTFSIYEE